MAKKKPRPVEREPEAEPAPPPSRSAKAGKAVLKAVFRPKRLLALAVLAAVAAAVPVVWRHRPDLDLSGSPTYRLTPADIRVTPPPPPVPANVVERAVGTAGPAEELSVLDRDLLPRLAAAFAADPWVKRVVGLKKGLPAHVDVELEYRTPVAMIDVKAGVYPIDADGVLLPPGDLPAVTVRRYPLVTGVRTVPGGPPGQPWGDPVVAAAAKVAAAVAADWDELGLAAIVAPAPATAAPAADELSFDLTTRGGSRVLWGRPPGTGHPGELTAEQKVGRLKRYVADFGRLDTPGPAFEIDIRPWQEITRKPLAAAGRDGRERR